jgi:tetratricopeptide (TPR) repeat protein
VDERIERAWQCYQDAVFGGDSAGLSGADRELDGVEADLALARGRIVHARFLQERDAGTAAEDPAELPLFERAAELYRALGDVRGEGESLFWIGCFHQVVRRDNAAAAPYLNHSYELAAQADDKLTMSEALRHLGIAAHAGGEFDLARERLEQSTQLRREINLLPGVAANLIGLAYIAAAQERRDDAVAILDEAAALAKASNAGRILRTVEQARAELRALDV